MARIEYYTLFGHTPIPETDVLKWATWCSDPENKRVAIDLVAGVLISTVFLGLDHNWDNGPPILFETMVFGGWSDGAQRRYSTWDEAIAGHKEMVEEVLRMAQSRGAANPPAPDGVLPPS